MKQLTMFYLEDCGYCAKARKALEELCSENPEYQKIPIQMIEESREPELADQYDYYAVPSFFDRKEKLFEAHLFMSYEDIRNEVRRVLDYALSAPEAVAEL
ncbi:MAG: thioredoxin family protein [Lachnospiraceae bacterium]|nr:thioredoxin family protein [Lachnospiraceae bacterium]